VGQHRDRFNRIISRSKSHPIVASAILFGTIVIALSTFTDAVKNLVSLAGKVGESTVINVSGTWEARVTYASGHTYEERFTFRVSDDALVGTASFLGRGRGIREGQAKDDEVSFTLTLEELLGTETRPYRRYYRGRVSGNEIHFTMQDDKGNPPVKFTARRSAD